MQDASATAWPKKTRELHNHHMDSTVWNDFPFREGDTIIATWGKSGTTWMQQIVSQLIFEGAEGIDLPALSPWLDLRIMPKEAIEAVKNQPHRRVIKTHLPAEAMVISPKAKYIYIARDGRDAVWSAYNHMANFKPEVFGLFNNTPGRVGPELKPPPASVHQFYREWFEKDGYPLWSFWENIRSWWNLRHLPNVLLIHFNDMKRDLPGTVRQVANFLELERDEKITAKVVEHASFDWMKRHAHLAAPMGGAIWEGGATTFINKGTNGRWQGTLTPADIRAYDARAMAELGPDCAAWLEAGRFSRAVA
ncbi:sulfotransferase domain-containing protein [Aestuariivirga sp.]|uniref:sulfotransferase domain-containing protein n=1 Tax=Aestuariivirga sp. TaxID=2650926 RepID=UPI003BACFF8E